MTPQRIALHDQAGIVASGVIFDDGTTVLRSVHTRSTVIWASVHDALVVHNGRTTVEWIDSDD